MRDMKVVRADMLVQLLGRVLVLPLVEIHSFGRLKLEVSNHGRKRYTSDLEGTL